MQFQKLKERFYSYHPVFQALIFTLPVSLTVFLHYLLAGEVLTDKSPLELLRSEYKNMGFDRFINILDVVLWDPVKEEFFYRFPVVIVAWIAIPFRNPLKGKNGIYYTLMAFAWILAIILTFYWAFIAIPHKLPITVFGYGLIWSWLAIRTKFILYSIILHMGCNATAILAMLVAVKLL